MLKSINEVTGNVLAGVAIFLVGYYHLVAEATVVTFALSICYFLIVLMSKKNIYLYPATILFSASYLLSLTFIGGYNSFHLLALPLVVIFYGSGYYLQKQPVRGFSLPLEVAAHLNVVFLTFLLLTHVSTITNHVLVLATMVIYAGLYFFLYRLKQDAKYIFPALIFSSLVYYFGLPLVVGLLPQRQLAYYIFVSVIFVLLGYGFQKRGDLTIGKPFYWAAVAIAVVTSIIVLVKADIASGRVVLLVSSVVYGIMILLFKRQEFVFLVTLSLGFLAYNLMQISGDKFSRALVHYFLYGLIAVGLVFFYPLAKRVWRYTKPFSFLIAKNWKGIVMFALPIAAIVPLILAVYGYEATKNPYVCGTCHTVEPLFKTQFETWQTSVHKNVDCVKCHYPPGLRGFVQGKIDGVRHLTLFVTKSYSTREHDEISDKACLRSGCHVREKLYGKVVFGAKIKYNHEAHLKGKVRQMQLRCTTCHAHVVKSQAHFEVSESVCFQCHLKGRGEKPTAVGSCLSCHDIPTQTLKTDYGEYNHAEFFADRKEINCMHCHSEVTTGDGEVRKEKCLSCHNEANLDKVSSQFLHDKHITERKVECFECHTEMQHGIKQARGYLATNCGTCHTDQHTAASRVYAGRGGLGVEEMPSPMFAANVDCGACHRFDRISFPKGVIMLAKRQACDDCHGPENQYSTMMDEWQQTTKENVSRVRQLLQQVESKMKGSLSENSTTRLYKEAKFNLDLVVADGSLGVHNYSYIEELLSQAEKNLKECAEVLK